MISAIRGISLRMMYFYNKPFNNQIYHQKSTQCRILLLLLHPINKNTTRNAQIQTYPRESVLCVTPSLRRNENNLQSYWRKLWSNCQLMAYAKIFLIRLITLSFQNSHTNTMNMAIGFSSICVQKTKWDLMSCLLGRLSIKRNSMSESSKYNTQIYIAPNKSFNLTKKNGIWGLPQTMAGTFLKSNKRYLKDSSVPFSFRILII